MEEQKGTTTNAEEQEETVNQKTEETCPKTEEKAPETTQTEEKDAPKAENETELKLKDMTDKYLRLSAEFDNYRKRTLKEKMDLVQNAGDDLLKKLLPVVDNFERAMASIEKSDDVAALREGVAIIYNGFKEFLHQNGVKEIECMNAPFNYDEQEAVTKIPAPSEEMKGKVIDCIKKGYTLNGKILRYAQVVVGE